MRWALNPRSHLDWMTSRQGSQSLVRPRRCPTPSETKGGVDRSVFVSGPAAAEPGSALAGFASPSTPIEPEGALAGFGSAPAITEPGGALAGFGASLA